MLLFRGCTVHCFQATKIDKYLKTYASNTSSVTGKKRQNIVSRNWSCYIFIKRVYKYFQL